MFPDIESEQAQENLFQKGDFVFGICDNELPWPGKITKIYLQNSYGVKFIGHKSFAVLQQSNLLKFDEENINRVVIQYNMSDPNKLTKIIRAIELSKSDEMKIARKKEKETNKEKVQSKRVVNEGKKHKKPPQVVIHQDQKPLTRRQAKKSLKKNRQSAKIAESAQKQELKASAFEYLPSNCEKNQESIKSNKTISKLLCQIQASKSNQTPSSEAEPHENWSRLCLADESLQNSLLSTQQTLPILVYDRQQEQQQQKEKQNTQLVISEQLKIVPYLQYLISFISKEVDEPLSRQEKRLLKQLLQNNRKLTYGKDLLEHMIRFIVAFNSSQNEDRKLCVIQYIKVKERVETMVMLRQIMQYDETINQILDQYKKA